MTLNCRNKGTLLYMRLFKNILTTIDIVFCIHKDSLINGCIPTVPVPAGLPGHLLACHQVLAVPCCRQHISVVIRGYVPQGAGFYTRYYVYVI